eukprot:SAG31_NODE_1319_length_8817_cov_1.857077_12_plen_68_part_00
MKPKAFDRSFELAVSKSYVTALQALRSESILRREVGTKFIASEDAYRSEDAYLSSLRDSKFKCKVGS